MRNVCICFLALISLSACQESSIDPLPMYRDYYPIQVGQQSVFSVDSIAYDGFSGRIDTFSFWMLEEIDSFYLDEVGVATYLFYASYSWDSIQWTLYRSGEVRLHGDKLEKTEENKAFVKLVFPVVEGIQWLGNISNGDPGESKYNYEYLNVHASETIGMTTHDSALTVFHYHEISPFNENKSLEKYAKGVGLIYKELKELNTQGVKDGFELKVRRI